MAASHLVSTVAQLQHGSGGGAMQLRYEPLRGLVIYNIYDCLSYKCTSKGIYMLLRGLVMRMLALPLPLPLPLTPNP